jgi:hypothetical protein
VLLYRGDGWDIRLEIVFGSAILVSTVGLTRIAATIASIVDLRLTCRLMIAVCRAKFGTTDHVRASWRVGWLYLKE